MRMKYYTSVCKDWLRGSFLRREDGTIAVEAVIILPVIFWSYLCMFAIYDAYRMYSVHQKAAFSIGDAISRETAEIDDAYFDGIHDLFEYLSHSQGKTNMRISQLWFEQATNTYHTDWSEVRGSIAALDDTAIASWNDRLPLMPDNERILLLETFSDYDPPFDTGLTTDEIRTFVFTSPRYAPGVCYDSCS